MMMRQMRRHYRYKIPFLLVLIGLVGCTAFGCTAENPGEREQSAEDAGLDAPLGDVDPGDLGIPDADWGDADGGEPDGDESGPADADAGPDDADDADASSLRTLSDYRTCTSNIDCPVGLGVCVKELTFNQEDADGTESVLLSELFDELGDDEGVCTLECTNDPQVCASLSVNGNAPDPVEHTCQLVAVGQAPYPDTPPEFPFADQLDPDAQSAGQSFAAICRPPFELDDEIDDSFCAQCDSDADCSEQGSTCWSLLEDAPAAEGDSGICLSECADQDDCPLGFSCTGDDSDGRFCRPTLDTCTDCRDVDEDGWGTGRCGTPEQPITAHDCDDRNADAYFDRDQMDHAFPAHCGEQDFNCNGLSDDTEQLGAQSYPVEHCVSCYDDCQGGVDNGEFACQTSADTSEATCAVQCETDSEGQPLFADCNGDPADGCEVAIDDPTRLYYRDADGDGFGDPNEVAFACDPDEAPDGYVSNDDDCNDSETTVYGGSDPADEVCDGLDNDCDGNVDEGLSQQGQSCTTNHPGVCSTGTWQCFGASGFVCQPDIAPGSQNEVCDGVDNDCDGDVDEDGAQGATAYYPDNDADGYGDAGASARYACNQPSGYVLNNGDCDDANPQANPGRDELCSTSFDDDCDGQTNEDSAADATRWYRDADSDTWGNANDSTMSCTQPSGYVDRDGDCDDQSQAVNPDADEVCHDGVDNDCDGQTDDASAVNAETFYADDDADGFGDPYDSVDACSTPSGYVTNDNDCNDDTSNRGSYANPAQVELCDGIDNDCDGRRDEGCPTYRLERVGSHSATSSIGPDIIQPDYTVGSDTDICPSSDSVLTRVRVQYNPGSYPVETIDTSCQWIEVDENTSQYPYTYSLSTSSGTTGWDPGPGDTSDDSTWDFFSCPSGSAIYKVSVEYGGVFDRVRFHCRSLELNGSGTNSALATGSENDSKTFGASADNSDAVECPYGEVAVGMSMTAGYHHPNYNAWSTPYPTLFKVGLHCQELGLVTK